MLNFLDLTCSGRVSDTGLSNRDSACFHYHNPNGAGATLARLQDEVFEAIEQGRAKTGAYFTFGPGNRTYIETLRRLTYRRRVLTSEIQSLLRCIRWEIDRTEEFLQSVS